MNSWWETPLNLEFLDKIIHEIGSGKIAMVFLPKHTPNGFLSQLKSRFEKTNHVAYERINLNDCDEKKVRPIETKLISELELESKAGQFVQRKASAIFSKEEYVLQRIFVFENLSHSLLKEFREFIIDLGRYLVSVKQHERHKIIVTLNPENFKPSDFSSESGIQRIIYQGVFDKLDCNLGLRYFSKYEDGNFTLLYEKIIASLSLFDTELAESLIECDNLIEDYPNILKTFAKNRGWDAIEYKPVDRLTEDQIWDRWSKGILEKSENKLMYHSAFLKINDKNKELYKRVWQSGVEVLIPLIEEVRDRILKSDKFEYPDEFPDKQTGEPINSNMDLEIGEICYFVNTYKIRIRGLNKNDKRNVRDFINLCKTIRNDLSHLRMPSAQNIKKFFEGYSEVGVMLNSDGR